MTDRSKSPRKRRLQLNAEEFAPPSDMYETSEEPRLDETWVQFYGGERQGVKKLSSLDEETPAEKGNLPVDISPREPAADLSTAPPTLAQGAAEPSPIKPLASAKTPEIFPSDSGPRLLPSTVKPLRRRVNTDSPDESRLQKQDAAPTPQIQQTFDSKAARLPESDSSGVPFPAVADSETPLFEEWSKRWSPWLKRGGSIKVCEAFFQLTHARGSTECLTSNSEIMKLTDLSRAQCIRNIHYLIEIGFLDELDEVNNKDAKGTYYRFNLVPSSLVNSQP